VNDPDGEAASRAVDGGAYAAAPARDRASVQARVLADITALCAFGLRPVGSSAHDAARARLVSRLTALGLTSSAGDRFELPYRVRGESFVNVVAVAFGAVASGAVASGAVASGGGDPRGLRRGRPKRGLTP
jgi:hypothetical protein